MPQVASTLTVPELSDLVPPATYEALPPFMLSGRPTPPSQVIFFYASDEWENFIREWATGLPTAYTQIKKLGGANDEGVDVAAFKTGHGFEGPWDCFQGKHYSTSLVLSDVLPEMLKVFRHAVAGDYVLPDRYKFLAPKGCSNTLNRLLSKPSRLRSAFLDRCIAGTPLAGSLDALELVSVRAMAESTDFSMFQSEELPDLLDVHRSTKYFSIRFGGPLPIRPKPTEPPAVFGGHEARYVEQLIGVYVEKHGDSTITPMNVVQHGKTGIHFQRQRVSFYRAEALKKFAENSVPDGTFEALQEDVRTGVIDVAERVYATGFDRLSRVMETSGKLSLTSHTLMSQSDNKDIQGICHQLANEDRLTWNSEIQG